MTVLSQPPRIAVDAMGGDRAPQVVVEGVRAFLAESAEDRIILVGHREEIEKCGTQGLAAEIVHTEQVVEMHDPPATAVRRKRGSSMAAAVNLLAAGKADAVVSLGNTGAFMAFCKTVLGSLPGIHRPAIAVPMPTKKGQALLLDAGANADSQPEYLRDFALMGDVYCREVMGKPKPRVGLLSLGTEENKGKELTKSAARLIRELPIEFVGNVEGGDVSRGEVDVIVCDGFTGNVVLKYGEGLAEMLVSSLLREISEAGWSSSVKQEMEGLVVRCLLKTDYCETGGAPLLGIQGNCVKAHGRSTAKAVTNALHSASRAAGHRINELVVERLAALSNNGQFDG